MQSNSSFNIPPELRLRLSPPRKSCVSTKIRIRQAEIRRCQYLSKYAVRAQSLQLRIARIKERAQENKACARQKINSRMSGAEKRRRRESDARKEKARWFVEKFGVSDAIMSMEFGYSNEQKEIDLWNHRKPKKKNNITDNKTRKPYFSTNKSKESVIVGSMLYWMKVKKMIKLKKSFEWLFAWSDTSTIFGINNSIEGYNNMALKISNHEVINEVDHILGLWKPRGKLVLISYLIRHQSGMLGISPEILELSKSIGEIFTTLEMSSSFWLDILELRGLLVKLDFLLSGNMKLFEKHVRKSQLDNSFIAESYDDFPSIQREINNARNNDVCINNNKNVYQLSWDLFPHIEPLEHFTLQSDVYPFLPENNKSSSIREPEFTDLFLRQLVFCRLYDPTFKLLPKNLPSFSELLLLTSHPSATQLSAALKIINDLITLGHSHPVFPSTGYILQLGDDVSRIISSISRIYEVTVPATKSAASVPQFIQIIGQWTCGRINLVLDQAYNHWITKFRRTEVRRMAEKVKLGQSMLDKEDILEIAALIVEGKDREDQLCIYKELKEGIYRELFYFDNN